VERLCSIKAWFVHLLCGERPTGPLVRKINSPEERPEVSESSFHG